MFLCKHFNFKFYLMSDLTGHTLHSEVASKVVTAIGIKVPECCL